MSEEHFAGLDESRWWLVTIQEMMKHPVENLFHVRLRQIQHQLSLAQEMLHVQVCPDLRRKILHRNFLRAVTGPTTVQQSKGEHFFVIAPQV